MAVGWVRAVLGPGFAAGALDCAVEELAAEEEGLGLCAAERCYDAVSCFDLTEGGGLVGLRVLAVGGVSVLDYGLFCSIMWERTQMRSN